MQSVTTRPGFLSRMGHELRTPLSAIIGFAQLLAQDAKLPLDADQRRMVNGIEAAGRQLQQLLIESVELSGLEAGRGVPRPVACDPDVLVDAAFECLLPLATAGGFTLRRSERMPAAIRVAGDPAMLVRCLATLGRLAAERLPSGQPLVLSVLREPQRVVLRVTATGASAGPAIAAWLAGGGDALERLPSSTGLTTVVGLQVADAQLRALGALLVVSGHDGSLRFDACLPACSAVPDLRTVLCVAVGAEWSRALGLAAAGDPDLRLVFADDAQEGWEAAGRTTPDRVLIGAELGDMAGDEWVDALRDAGHPAAGRCLLLPKPGTGGIDAGQAARLLAGSAQGDAGGAPVPAGATTRAD